MFEVQRGLAGEEGAVDVLRALGLPPPGPAGERAEPVVGRAAVIRGIRPDIPIRLGIVAALPAFLEPGVLVGGMAENEVGHDLQVSFMGLGNERARVVKRPVGRMDGHVIGDVVAVVHLR